MRARSKRLARGVVVSILGALIVPTGLAVADGGHGHGLGSLLDSWTTAIGGLFLLGSVVTVPAYRRVERRRESHSAMHLVAALLAVFSGSVHLYLFIDHGSGLMLLAGLGFFAGVALLVANIDHRGLYALGVGFVLAQVLLWILDGTPHLGSFGLIDKVVQIVLIGVLGFLYATTSD